MTSHLPYQLLDPLPDDVYEALKADIAESGMVYPVVLDESGAVLDGHHRKRIAEELGIEYPARVLPGLSEEEKVDRSLALNLLHRQQSREEKRETIRRYLLRRPDATDNHAAQVIGASNKTVAAVRAVLAANWEIPNKNDRVEETGRKARGRKPKAPDPAAVAKREAELAKSRASTEKQQAKRQAERAEAEALTKANMAPGGVMQGKRQVRAVATQDRIKAALSECVVALTRALQDPGLDADLAAAEMALPPDFRIKAATARLRKLTTELDSTLTTLAKTSRTERDSADRQ